MPIQISLSNAIGALQGLAGGGPGPGPTPPLDTYTDAAAAYSVRLLRTAYSGTALRVRRAVPPYDEQDIGFTAGGDLDEAAIVAFGGSDVLNVSAWYDQSGQSNHATQITPNSQPQIYNGTAVITENGKPAIRFFQDLLTFTQIDFAGAMHLSHVLNQTGFYYSLGGDSGSTYTFSVTPTAYRYTLQSPIGNITATAALTNGQQFHTQLQRDASNLIETFADNTAGGSSTSSGTFGFDRIGGRTTGAWRDNQQELILWASDISDAQSDIATNINTYYEIIVNDEAATSGFLFDYPNAAVAYSVRQLNNNAEYAMQVERSDGRTKNIGFDGNGDLDTQAIIDFSGASAATISAWYDQTGNQNHSRQSNPIKQPEIYNGTAINTDNGKPSLLFTDPGQDSNRDLLTWNSNVDTQLFTWSTVAGFAPPGALRTIIHNGYTGTSNYLRVDSSGYIIVNTSFNGLSGSTFDGTQKQNTIVRSSATTATSYQNNSQTGTISTLNTSNISWGSTEANITGSGILSFNVQEIVLWGSDQDAAGNRSNIDTNMKTYFTIP